ncbi:MAG: class I SAM-dependent methyltransferase [Patescibacteria group bacterium]
MNDKTAQNLYVLTKEGYHTIAKPFSATRRFSWDDCTPLRTIVKDGMSVLDVGCGNGRTAELFTTHSIQYTGIDLNESFIHDARKRFSNDHTKEFYCGDMLTLNTIKELEGRHFDVIFSIAVLHHAPSEQLRMQALSQMHLFLKSEGTLFLTAWNLWRATLQKKSVWKYALERSLLDPGSYQRAFGVDYRDLSWRDLLTTWKSGILSAPLYYYSFRCNELVALCLKSGFTVLDCYYSLKGKRAHWWNAENICLIAKKEAR